MGYYLILATDAPGTSALRLALRQRHLDYWLALGAAVKAGGARLADGEPEGSFLIVEAADDAAARAMIDADPFTLEGVFAAGASVAPVRPSIGDWLPPA